MPLAPQPLRRHFAAAFLAAQAFAFAGTNAQAQPPSDFLSFAGNTQKVWGYVDWCAREKTLCNPDFNVTRPAYVVWNKENRRTLQSINKNWNHATTPETDEKIYGVSEYWTIPTKAGDCEDYVLGKRQELIERGFPRNALLITLVTDKDGLGHAVLSVQTTTGTRILDNMTDDIKLWHATPYKFVKSQNPQHPATWQAIDNTHPLPTPHIATPKIARDPIAALIRQTLD